MSCFLLLKRQNWRGFVSFYCNALQALIIFPPYTIKPAIHEIVYFLSSSHSYLAGN